MTLPPIEIDCLQFISTLSDFYGLILLLHITEVKYKCIKGIAKSKFIMIVILMAFPRYYINIIRRKNIESMSVIFYFYK